MVNSENVKGYIIMGICRKFNWINIKGGFIGYLFNFGICVSVLFFKINFCE